MKGRISITAAILIFLVSCEKGETDNTILKFYSKSYKETGNGIAITKDNTTGEDLYYYICGQFTDELSSIAKGKPGVYRSGPDGNMIDSAMTLSGYEGSASRIIALGDGDLLCTGYVLDENSEKDLFVWKINPDLTTDTLRIYDSADNQYGVDLIEISGGFLVLATTDSKRDPAGEVTGNPKGRKDILLMKIDADLKPLAAIPAVGYNGNDEGAAVKKDINGGYIVVGTTDRSDLPPDKQAGTNIIIVKLNENGNTTEPRIAGGTQNEAAADFEVLTDGYLIAGTIENTGSTQQGCIWKMPDDIYNSIEYEQPVILDPLSPNTTPYSVKAMCRYKTNSFLLAGHYNTGLSARMLVFSIDVYGTTDLNRIKKTGGTGTQVANDVASGESGNIVAVGSNSFENNSMVCFLKFRF